MVLWAQVVEFYDFSPVVGGPAGDDDDVDDGDKGGEGGVSNSGGAAEGEAAAGAAAGGLEVESGDLGEVLQEIHRGACKFEADLDSGELLVTTRGGATRRIGHRSLRRYYRQHFPGEDQRASVRAAQRENLLLLYRQSGLDPAATQAGGAGVAGGAADLAKRKQLMQRAAATKAERQLQRQLYHFAQMAKGNSKGLAGQFVFRPDAADNAARRAIVHHWGAGGGGSHYNMAAAAGRSKGTSKGLLSRHSKQGARLQAARNMSRARDAAKGQMGVRNNAQKTGGGQGGRNKSKGNSKGE